MHSPDPVLNYISSMPPTFPGALPVLWLTCIPSNSALLAFREEFKDISPQLLSTGGVTPLLIKDPVADALDRFLRKDYYPRVVDDQIRSTFQVVCSP